MSVYAIVALGVALAAGAFFLLTVALLRVQAELRKRLAQRHSRPPQRIGPPMTTTELVTMCADMMDVLDAYDVAGRRYGVLMTGPHPDTGIVTVLETDDFLPSLLGISRHEFLREGWMRHIEPLDIERTLRLVEEPQGELVNRYIGADGEHVWLRWRWWRDERGRGWSIAAQHLGHGSRKRTAEILEELQRRSEKHAAEEHARKEAARGDN